MCGLATNSCVVCTAYDAKMREFRLFVPPDCWAERSHREHLQANAHIRAMTDASVALSTSLRLVQIARDGSHAG
jgi:nicotinamidase-related amidase